MWQTWVSSDNSSLSRMRRVQLYISKSAHQKGGPCLKFDFYKNLIFSKKEITGKKVKKEENVRTSFLDPVCNTIWKSAHHKGGPCLQLHLYNIVIFW